MVVVGVLVVAPRWHPALESGRFEQVPNRVCHRAVLVFHYQVHRHLRLQALYVPLAEVVTQFVHLNHTLLKQKAPGSSPTHDFPFSKHFDQLFGIMNWLPCFFVDKKSFICGGMVYSILNIGVIGVPEE